MIIDTILLTHKASGRSVPFWTNIKPSAFTIAHTYPNSYTNSQNGTYLSIGDFDGASITFDARLNNPEDKDVLFTFLTGKGEVYTLSIMIDGRYKYLDVALESIDSLYHQYGYYRPITISVKPLYYWYSEGVNILDTRTGNPVVLEEYPYTYDFQYAYQEFFMNGEVTSTFTNNTWLPYPLIIEIEGGYLGLPQWTVTNNGGVVQRGKLIQDIPVNKVLTVDSRHLEQTVFQSGVNFYDKVDWSLDTFIYLQNGISTINIKNVQNVVATAIELSVMP